MSATGSQRRESIGAALKNRRVQLALAAVAAAVATAIVVVAVVSSGNATEPPATGAATVVPGDALAYVHFSTDRSRPAVRDALRLAGRLPTFSVLSGVVTSRLAAIAAGSTGNGASSSLNYQDDIRPWLGKEAAIAFLDNSTSRAGAEIVLDVKSLAKARAFVARSGASPAGSHRGVSRYRSRTGTELAFVRHYLVLGTPATVDGAIDAARDRALSLAGTTAYQRAATGEPAGRVLDMYFPTAGITRLLAAQGGVIGALGTLLYEPSELGSTVSVSASGAGARLYVHTALQGPGGVRGRPFTPALASELPSSSLLVLDVTGLDRVAPRVLAAGADAGIAGRLGPLLGHLGTALASEGVNVHSIQALFDGETAVAIESASKGTPALVVLARIKNERKARSVLADLEVPLSQLFPAPNQGSGQVPGFSAHQIGGVSAHQIILAQGLTLDYAVFRGMVVISTSLGGIAAIARRSGSLRNDPVYSQTLPGQPRPVTSLVFANFSQLLRLAQRTGLVRGATYQALRPDLNRIRAVGLQTTRGHEDTTAQITLDIP